MGNYQAIEESGGIATGAGGQSHPSLGGKRVNIL
jgi:hypothetical protein